MMARLFSRSKVGPWLLVLALAWYFGGAFLIHLLRQQSIAQAKSLHHHRQQFDVGTQLLFSLEKDKSIRSLVKLEFDQHTSQVVVENDDLGIKIQGQLLNGVLHLKASQPIKENNRHHSYGDITVRVPVSVHKVELDASQNITLVGNAAVPELELTLSDCHSDMTLEQLAVRQLRLISRCSDTAPAERHQRGFSLNAGLAAESLIVTMPTGNLSFEAKKIPTQILLNLGDTVEVKAPSDFLRTARFVKLP